MLLAVLQHREEPLLSESNMSPMDAINTVVTPPDADNQPSFLPISSLNFTDHAISHKFRDGRLLYDLVNDLMSGVVHPVSTLRPLDVVRHKDSWWALSNRRLWCLKAFAGLVGNLDLNVRVNIVQFSDIEDDFAKKLAAESYGRVVRVTTTDCDDDGSLPSSHAADCKSIGGPPGLSLGLSPDKEGTSSTCDGESTSHPEELQARQDRSLIEVNSSVDGSAEGNGKDESCQPPPPKQVKSYLSAARQGLQGLDTEPSWIDRDRHSVAKTTASPMKVQPEHAKGPRDTKRVAKEVDGASESDSQPGSEKSLSSSVAAYLPDLPGCDPLYLPSPPGIGHGYKPKPFNPTSQEDDEAEEDDEEDEATESKHGRTSGKAAGNRAVGASSSRNRLDEGGFSGDGMFAPAGLGSDWLGDAAFYSHFSAMSNGGYGIGYGLPFCNPAALLGEAAEWQLDGSHGADIEATCPSEEWKNVTTVMLCNLSAEYTQASLLEEINLTGFAGCYDFFYLPIDPVKKLNRGYAFINFIDAPQAWKFAEMYEGRQMNIFNVGKVATVMPAAVQGYLANHAHYANSRVIHGKKDARPLFFRHGLHPGNAVNYSLLRRRGAPPSCRSNLPTRGSGP
eukprot:TRINITY_DN20838_c0_g1_i1.p1 TRINITY_DN20838_c0_g1~~TRINITY_DN20838_c0_g1_i1.p1  ORF type:complete len:619 (-),score=102.93 TRINITY_DN20838_c0_g1_i1:389-2245(-)